MHAVRRESVLLLVPMGALTVAQFDDLATRRLAMAMTAAEALGIASLEWFNIMEDPVAVDTMMKIAASVWSVLLIVTSWYSALAGSPEGGLVFTVFYFAISAALYQLWPRVFAICQRISVVNGVLLSINLLLWPEGLQRLKQMPLTCLGQTWHAGFLFLWVHFRLIHLDRGLSWPPTSRRGVAPRTVGRGALVLDASDDESLGEAADTWVLPTDFDPSATAVDALRELALAQRNARSDTRRDVLNLYLLCRQQPKFPMSVALGVAAFLGARGPSVRAPRAPSDFDSDASSSGDSVAAALGQLRRFLQSHG